MFGMPAFAGINPGDNGFKGDQVRGFGFLHDGSIDTLFRFHNGAVFNQNRRQSRPASRRRRRRHAPPQMETFMLAFDSNLSPIVGQQATRTSTSGAAVDARIDLLIDPRQRRCVRRRREGRHRWRRTRRLLPRSRQRQYSGSTVRRTDGHRRDLARVRRVPGQELTYTCVPRLSGTRIGIDRDSDNFLDRDELDEGSDPADPTSVPCSGRAGANGFGADPTCGKCRRAITKSSARYTQDIAKAYSACETAKLKGSIPPATDCIGAPDAGTLAKLTKADAAFTKAVDKACGGDDGVCGGDTTGEPTPEKMRFPAVCPNFEGSAEGACSAAIDGCGAIKGCLACIAGEAVRQAITLDYGAFTTTDPATPVGKCQQAIGKETNAFLAAKSTALAKCWAQRQNGKHTRMCPDASAPAGSPSRKAADAIAKADAKRAVKVCKACGGPDRLCDGTNDLTPRRSASRPRAPTSPFPTATAAAAPSPRWRTSSPASVASPSSRWTARTERGFRRSRRIRRSAIRRVVMATLLV